MENTIRNRAGIYPSKALLTDENADRSGRNCECATQNKVTEKILCSAETKMQMHNQDDNNTNSMAMKFTEDCKNT